MFGSCKISTDKRVMQYLCNSRAVLIEMKMMNSAHFLTVVCIWVLYSSSGVIKCAENITSS